MLIYTCPKCGSDLRGMVYTIYPPRYAHVCDKCGWKHEDNPQYLEYGNIVRVPYPMNEE